MVIADHGYAGSSERLLRCLEGLTPSAFAVQLRAHELNARDADTFGQLARRARDVLDPAIPMFLNGTESLAKALGYDGVHYPEYRLAEPTPACACSTAAAHSIDAALRADEKGVGAVFFSPVFAPSWKAGEAQGLEALARFTRQTPLPVYALGGMTAARVGTCLDTGAHGIAVVGSVMGANDPNRAIDQLLLASFS